MRAIFFLATLFTFQILWMGWGFDFLRTIWTREELSSGYVGTIWLLIYTAYAGGLFYSYWCVPEKKEVSKKYREFGLQYCRVMDSRFPGVTDYIYATPETETFIVPAGVKEFWVNLEDTDEGDEILDGFAYHVNATYHLDRKAMDHSSNDDVLHVTIALNGEYTVRYLGNEYTNGVAMWSISAERE